MEQNRKQISGSSKGDNIAKQKTADFLSFLRKNVPNTPAPMPDQTAFPDGGPTASQYPDEQYPQAQVPFTGPYSQAYYNELEMQQSPENQSRDNLQFEMERYRDANPGNPQLTQKQLDRQNFDRDNNIDLDMKLSKEAREDALIQFPTAKLDPNADFVSTPSNPIEQGKERSFGSGQLKEQFGNNPYLASEALNVGMAGLSRFMRSQEENKRSIELRKEASNVHGIYGTRGSDRGDYMVNTAGVGDNLKPDEHLRKGFNTKIARDGLEVGSELELSDEEIADLKAQGYDIEFLD